MKEITVGYIHFLRLRYVDVQFPYFGHNMALTFNETLPNNISLSTDFIVCC